LNPKLVGPSDPKPKDLPAEPRAQGGVERHGAEVGRYVMGESSQPGESAPTLPLAEASQRLRRRPRRTKKHPEGGTDGDSAVVPASDLRMKVAQRPQSAVAQLALRPIPRLLDRAAAARYLSVSVDVLDRLARRGFVRRRVLPGTRCIRFDVRDLDRVIESS
jgi:hypothetical protein